MVEEENMAEDSQDMVVPFSLHLTQSQTDMDSQAPSAMELIDKVIFLRQLKLYPESTLPMW